MRTWLLMPPIVRLRHDNLLSSLSDICIPEAAALSPISVPSLP
jgi:hypothetical protein